MSTGTNVRATCTRKIHLLTARFEAYLSTHAFEILFLGIYLVANILMYTWGAHDEFIHTRKLHPDKPHFKWYIAVARGAGYTLNLNCAIVLILASKLFMTAIRDSPLHKVLPLDKSFPAAHIIVGYFILVGVAIHVPFHFVWIFTYDMLDKFTWWSFSMSVAVGVPLLVVFLTMFSTALPWFRRKFFRTFYVIHLIGATLFFALLVFHGMYNQKPETFKWILPAMILYIIDRICRRLKTSTVDLELSSFHCTLRYGGVLELRLPKLFEYHAGQYAEISVPFLSKEWHPFTIASAPYEDNLVFYIKSTGDWTRQLYQEFENRISNPTLYNLQARIRGPYGAPAQHGTKEYKRLVLISGGIGGTPFASISKHLHNKREQSSCRFPSMVAGDVQSGYDDEGVPLRVSMAVDKLYDLNNFEEDDALMRRRSSITNRLSETISLEKSNGLTRVISNISKKSSNMAIADAIIDFGNDSNSAPRFPLLNQFRAYALTFLHSTRVSLFLLFTLVVRFSFVCIIAIWRFADFKWTLSEINPQAYWAIWADAALGIVLFVFMALTVTLEVTIMRKEYFSNPGRCLDILAFLPASLLSTILSMRSCLNPDRIRGTLTLTHFVIFLPVLFVLLSYRMYRSVGSRTLLVRRKKECGCSCGQNVPDVDYVWTTPKSDDDGWLRDELSSLAEGTDLRLHRYITREKDVSGSADHINVFSGRPDWDELFESIVDSTQSGGDVGVFFCGPPKMGSSIRSSLRDVEVRSNLRGTYLFSQTDKDIEKSFSAKSKDDVRRLRRFGCNVRFVFREENF